MFHADFVSTGVFAKENKSMEVKPEIRENDLKDSGVDDCINKGILFAQTWVNENFSKIEKLKMKKEDFTAKVLKDHCGNFVDFWTSFCRIYLSTSEDKNDYNPVGAEKKDVTMDIEGKKEMFSIEVKFFKKVEKKSQITYYPYTIRKYNEKFLIIIFIFISKKPGVADPTDAACGIIVVNGNNDCRYQIK